MLPKSDLYQQAHACILLALPAAKVSQTQALQRRWQAGEVDREAHNAPQAIPQPGRPSCLRLVRPAKLVQRSIHAKEGKAALVHAIAHIEFNAIDLALDAVYRFRDMPCQYYDDWLRIAAEEAEHFQLVQRYLAKLGHDYGDFPAHNGLWDMARATEHDVLVRMALVPRVLEARGLDVTPGIMQKFRDVGDQEFVRVLEVIQRDEVGHVEAGSFWFHYLCDKRGLARQATFERLFQQYTQARIKLPLDRQARLQAGFTEQELVYLEGLA